jgi:quercetin dioxygenase-like cupin family protein
MRFKFENFCWDGVDKQQYKDPAKEGVSFKNVSRQNIVTSKDGVDFDVRYFEIGKGGFTSLETHQHIHIVMIARGKGKVIIGSNIFDTGLSDYFIIPDWEPHQLINIGDEPFGFFCTVNSTRDAPQMLSPEHVSELRKNEDIDKHMKINDELYFENWLASCDINPDVNDTK